MFLIRTSAEVRGAPIEVFSSAGEMR